MNFTKLAFATGIAVLTSAAIAAVTFDSATGTGFVGKGDVQLALSYNNKQLQDHAGSLVFNMNSIAVTEVSWECTNDRNEKVQERERTTTTTTTGIVSAVARVKNQITGFNLMGFQGTAASSSVTEGPGLNSCPSAPSTWSLTQQAGDPTVVSSSTTLTVTGPVNGVATTVELPITPAP
jgi:hypothetical protein